MLGSAEESSGSWVDGGNGLVGEEGLFDASEFQVVVEVEFHFLAIRAFQIRPGDHAGRERHRGAVEEFIWEVVLSGEDYGQDGFRVSLKLG